MTVYIIIVANSIQARIAEAYCRDKLISKDSIALVPLRPVRWSLGQEYIHKHLTDKLSRHIWRILGISLNAFLLKRRLNLSKRKFILIAPWHNEYLEVLSDQLNCLGTFYCEEGDLSYWKKDVMFDGKKNNKKYYLERRTGPAKRWLFDKNCSGFICTSKDCFPAAESSLKEIVTLSPSNYCNTTKKGDVIGVMPSASRMLRINIVEFLKEYLKKAPNGKLNYIKMHPSFSVYPKLEITLREALKLPEFKNTKIMNQDVDLELEILANTLILVGLESSVERFAIKNGSNYLKVSSLLMLQSDR